MSRSRGYAILVALVLTGGLGGCTEEPEELYEDQEVIQEDAMGETEGGYEEEN